MKTARWIFPWVLASVAGCATTTLDNTITGRPALNPPTQLASDGAACVVTGGAHTIASQALVRPGIELVSTANGVALGFRKTSHDGVVMKLDPSSARATQSVLLHSVDAIRRVVPFERDADTILATMDTDCKDNRLEGAVTISAKDRFVVGTAGGELAWASCASGNPRALWRLPDEKVRDLHGIALADGSFAVVFRQNGALWFGKLDAEKTPTSALSKIAEGSQLRSPTIAQSGEHLLVVWAEQVDGRDQWSLAGVSIAACGHATPLGLGLPPDDVQGDLIQPALTAVDANHFLLVWTEGTSSGHDVRAVTLEAEGHPIGPVLRVALGAESGWGRPALTADGRGAVVYFVPTDSGFAIAATPIACPLSSAPSRAVASTHL
jgi:hypothetical protein